MPEHELFNPDDRLHPPDAGMSLLTTLHAAGPDSIPVDGELRGADDLTAWEAEQVAYWLEPQRTCTAIMETRGEKMLDDLLLLAARACFKHRIHMPSRVRSAAIWHGIEPL